MDYLTLHPPRLYALPFFRSLLGDNDERWRFGSRAETPAIVRVGTTNEGNTTGIQDGLMVCQLKSAGTNEV